MKPTLKISESVIKRLSSVHEKCLGSLYGVFFNKTQFIIGLCVNTDDENCKIDQSFPTEVELCGLFEVNEHDKFDHTKLKDTIENIIITDNPLYLKVTLGAKNDVTAVFILNHKLETAKIETIKEEEFYSQFLHIRLKTQLPLICSPDEESIKEAIQEMVHHFEGTVIFHFQQQQVFLMEHSVSGMSSDSTVGDLHKHNLGSGTSNWNALNSLDILEANMYKKVSHEINSESRKNHAPIVCVDKKNYESLEMVLNLDALSIVHRNMPLKNIYEILVGSLYRNIGILQRTIVKHFQQSGGDHSKISYPEIFHFFPKECGHFITRVYAKNESECSLETDRRTLHGRLLLPLSVPIFRRSNRFLFKGELGHNSIISNPHNGLKPTSNGGDVVIVRGLYRYYHYCQDKMDDDGWGCAYRSLQTLASWFHLQGYTEKPVPTFRDIQKCLVDIGDKPSNFIGSRQWIGSTEVNFVLNSLLDVTCKILYCSSGEEVGSKGPELLNHFQVNGSPVMIGGGVLAHTILGVDYNRQTGSIKFLILDPHYTGSENLQVIQNKGWVGWKGVDFWNKTAYYNMCLPQEVFTEGEPHRKLLPGGGYEGETTRKTQDCHGGAQPPVEAAENQKENGLTSCRICESCEEQGRTNYGHRVKSINNPDQRVKIVKEFIIDNFPATPLLQYALEVEKITTSKKPNLNLNVDGVIACSFVDICSDIAVASQGGDVVIVRGLYRYYHYCQDKMDDDGWGCAYRSLQTLASWFHLQGYTEKPVPTFRDIQKCLVDIGDKPSNFIGSRQWIGSTEVNFVLNSLLDVTCKILYCSSGEEVGSKGPELLNHFQVHGSPVMIGGVVLAHTILGVDYNRQTGSIKFLILDPHYTGSENLQVIQNKGWVGWKGVDFWNKTAYYNMCLPQVPHCI